jgi:Tfp pilus assembly protein PilX
MLRNYSDGWKCGIPRAVVNPREAGEIDNRGVALVITLLLLFLMSVLGLAAVLSTNSDIMINGYYGNSRASFYAADAGINIARQAMQTEVNSLVPTAWNSSAWNVCTAGTSAGPLSTSAGSSGAAGQMISAISQYANTTYLSGKNAGTGAGAAQYSWGESFSISNTGATNPYPVQLAANNPTINCIDGFPTQYTYQFNYTLTSVGTAAGLGSATVTENGSIFVNVIAPPGVVPENISFSSFGAYIGSSPPCQSSSYVAGTISGPTFVDATVGCSGSATHCGSWNFGTSGSYIFTDPVNQTGPKFSYNLNGCNLSTAASYSNGTTTIAPNFESGFNLGQQPIQIPTNDFSQRWAVLDGMGCGTSEGAAYGCGHVPVTLPPAPTPAQMTAYNLQNANQSNAAAVPYGTGTGSNTAATSGVFIPYTCSGSTCTLSPTAGGIWVEGSASGVTTSVQLSTTNGAGGSSNPSGQVIAVTQTFGSTTGSPVVSQSGSTSCSNGTCTANFQQQTTTTTPSTITTITIDPVAGTTKVSTVPSNANSTVTATASSSCTYSHGSCTPSTPGSGSFHGGSTSNSTNNGSPVNLTLAGVPQDLNSQAPTYPNTSTPAATMIYVDGAVSVSGPSSGAAIQNNSMVTLVANGNLTQTGNLTYATEPVTTTANGSTPADSLIAANENMNQVLGLYTAVGQFQLSPSSSGANMETDGTVAMISTNLTGCTNGVSCSNGDIGTPGNSVGTWTLIGGKAESAVNGVNMSKSNIYYDQRFKVRTNFAPPWFPQTTILAQDVSNGSTAPIANITQQRVQWVNQTGGQ